VRRLFLFLLLCLEKEAFAANWHIGLTATNQLNIGVRSCAQCERGLVLAKLADGVELLDLLSLGQQVEDRVESFALVSSA